MNQKTMNWRSRTDSLGYAFEGLKHALMKEPNMVIHALAALGVTIAGLARGLSRLQWVAIIGCIAAVWVAEIINTCIERLCDLYSGGQYHTGIKRIKDMAAAAVLVAATGSALTGFLIFTS